MRYAGNTGYPCKSRLFGSLLQLSYSRGFPDDSPLNEGFRVPGVPHLRNLPGISFQDVRFMGL
jgi:hypothetical protein